MGTNQSTQRRSSSPRQSTSNQTVIATSSINESDDEYTDCTDDFEDLSADITRSDDERAKNSKPLEGLPKQNDDVARSKTKLAVGSKQIESDDDDESLEDRKERQRREMEEFREEMNKKREMRQACIKKLREELTDLREKLSSEMETNAQLRETLEFSGANKTFDELQEENKKLKAELAECQMFLQTSNAENIDKTLESQALRDQVRSLKEVVAAMKEMLKIREQQIDQMKSKLKEIEDSMTEQETKIMSTALQQEYQRQLENIRNMRELYEERAALLIQERDTAKQKLEEKEHDLKTEIEK
jgi:chromosome segregation ATPase